VKVTNKTSGNAETSRVEYAYDAFDHMVGRKVFLNGSGTASESQHFVYDGGEIVLGEEKVGEEKVTATKNGDNG
jgi:YD repeat-containing protein